MSCDTFDFKNIRNSLHEILLSSPLRPRPTDTNANKCSKPKFKPRFRSENEKNYKAINAIIEIRELWKYVIHEASFNYSKTYAKLRIPIRDKLQEYLQKHKEDFGVYDKISEKWLVQTDEPKYKYCYDGETFKAFSFAKKAKTGNRLLLVGKYTILKQEPNLLKKTKMVPTLFETFVMPKKTLTVGVPGCGKTTYIIKNHNRGSLVLTSCAEGALDIRERMAKIKGGESLHYRDSYRTIDSYLLNSQKEYANVWIDEALMEHPGKLFLVCLFSRCRTLSLLGDPNQLGYINRVKAIRLRYEKSTMFFKTTNILDTSYRCPVDVIAKIADKYDGGAYSASEVRWSMKCKTLKSLKNIPNYTDVKYLVFKQAEKKKMVKAGYDVSTIHEFQGKEAADVILVRMSNNLEEPLYKSAPHILVGMSRHKESFVYYTPVKDDLKKLIQSRLKIQEIRQTQVILKKVK